MPSTPYTRGRSREYRTLRLLREWGWVCSRSAMSHGPVDLFAAKNGVVLLIQVKSGKGRMTASEARELARWAREFNAMGVLWLIPKRGRTRLVHVVDEIDGQKAGDKSFFKWASRFNAVAEKWLLSKVGVGVKKQVDHAGGASSRSTIP